MTAGGAGGSHTPASGGASGAGGAFGNHGGTTGADTAPTPATGELAIVELLINPTSTDTGREWIEIVNRAVHPVSLAGLHVSDAANDAAVDLSVAGTGPLAPGARAVLVQSADATKNGGITLGGAIAGGSFGTLVSLNNDADTISICVGACTAGGVLIDRVQWDSGLGTGYDGHALVIDDTARRCPATAMFGDGGSFGTPGAANGQCP
jgi:hypothetical protein